MRRIMWGALVLALLGPSGVCMAATWKCAANVSFPEGVALITLNVDDHSRPTVAGMTVDYSPAANRDDLNLMVTYWSVPKKLPALEPDAYLVARVRKNAARAYSHMVLTLGDQKFKMSGPAIQPDGVWGLQYLKPDSTLKRALLAGGPGQLDLIAANGNVLATEDLTIPAAGELQKAVDQGYQATANFAADPPHSEFCSIWIK